jgi:hypothetical protein
MVAGWSLSAIAAGTNAAAAFTFAMPGSQLRPMNMPALAEEPHIEPAGTNTIARQLVRLDRGPILDEVGLSSRESAAPQFYASVRGSILEMEVCRKLEEGGYLTRPEPETPLSRFMDKTFSPEVIHLGGHAKASCTLYTAIVRKNPLCLLNPMFLFISW